MSPQSYDTQRSGAGVVYRFPGIYHFSMISPILLAVAFLLFGVAVRMWLEFGQRKRQLADQAQRLHESVDTHKQGRDAIRARTADLKLKTKELVTRRDELQESVLKDRETLTAIERRLERAHPKSHRIDDDPRDEG